MDIPEHIQILLIEDNDDDAYLITEALEDEPYQITRLKDGQDAYTYLFTTNNPPNVVLVDYRLPGMSGLEIIQELETQGKEYGYIVLTVDMQIDTAIEVMKAGASDFLPKAKGYDFLPDMIRKVYRIQNDRQEKQQMEIALRESEERYRYMFQAAAVAMLEEDIGALNQALDDLRQHGVTDMRAYLDDHPEFVRNALHMIQVLDVNAMTVQLFKAQTKQELLGPLENLLIPEAQSDFKELLLSIAEQQTFFEQETQTRNLQGELLTISKRIAIPQTTTRPHTMLVNLTDITERKQAEGQLRFQAQLLENVRESIIATDLEGVIIYWGKGAEALYGYSAQEAWGQHVSLIVDPDAVPEELARIQHTLQTGTWRGEYVQRRKDGTHFLAETVLALITDQAGQPTGIIGIDRDITVRRRSEEALQRSEEQFRMLFEYAPLAMVIVRPDATCLVNTGFTDFLGYTQEDIASLSASELASLITHPADYAVENELAQNMFAGESDHYRLEKRYLKKNGEVVWGDLTTVRLPSEASETVLALSMAQDITHRKQAEEELKQAKMLAESANAAKSEFLANMSHELRTPLNAILGYAQILKRDRQLTQSQQHGLKVIERSGEYLLTLINDILDLSRIEARKLDLHPAELAFPEFLYGISEMIRIRAQHKNLSFSAEISPALPAMIQADEQRLSQILLNLLNNAVKFTNQGSVILRVTAKPFEVEGLCRIRFEVEDTGIGIPEPKRKQLFSPFTQLMEQGRSAEGTGLGLAISQQLAQLMGGRISVESTPEKGSLFWFEADFPVATASPENSRSQTPVLSGVEEPEIIGFQGESQALIVDDQAENRMVLQQMLASLGFEVEEAVNGREALEYVRNNRPDVIFMDLMMDELDGFEVTRRLRRIPDLDNTVVIAVSANVFQQTQIQSRDAGCDGFLAKPVKFDELLDCLHASLSLEWIYAAAEQQEDTHASEKDAVALPSHDVLDTLLNYVEMRSVTDLKRTLAALNDQNPELHAFTAQIEKDLRSYRFEKIREFLHTCMQD